MNPPPAMAGVVMFRPWYGNRAGSVAIAGADAVADDRDRRQCGSPVSDDPRMAIGANCGENDESATALAPGAVRSVVVVNPPDPPAT
jgi:hypothetical protein